MAAPASQPLTSFGSYRILRRIARGGMAEVYLAVKGGPGGVEKVVVLKRILPELSEVDEFVQVFLDEARIAARLDHPNIAHIYDLGESQSQYYLAMEYLPGDDLASVIQQCQRSQKLAPIEFAAEVVASACAGLHFAHTLVDGSGRPLNVVHRDVSPSNVVVTYLGEVKVIDFGIARAESNLVRTGAGKPKGKTLYMSPEQASGQPLDRRSDVFSIGIVLHELLTTRRLFRRPTEDETLQAVLADRIDAPSALRPEIPAELDRICMKALARPLHERYQSAEALGADLVAFLTSRRFARGPAAIADFMGALFPPERKLKKIRVGQGGLPEGGADRTPTIAPGYEGLTPIRTEPRLVSLPPIAAEQSVPTPSPVATGAALPVAAAPAPPAAARAPRPWARWIVAGTAVGLSAAGFAIGALWSRKEEAPRPPAPVTVPVKVVAQTPAPPLPVAGLTLSGLPPGVSVAVDGHPVKDPTAELYLEAGSHQVVVIGAGFAWSAPVELAAGEKRTLQMVMGRQPAQPTQPVAKGYVEVLCQPWCEIEVDGRTTGRTSPARLGLNPGAHRLRCINPALGTAKDQDVVVEVDTAQRVVFNLEE
ncbi:MAG TPA: serine/threonine-protein kinase [Myxococcaceae bacterium]|nr:serine/threonine-protein kinase [Myxococcaceae bacterium]